LNGEASVTLGQVAPVMGINHIGIEIIRAPDPSTPSGVGIVIGHGETYKEWQAPQVGLPQIGPAAAPVKSQGPYPIPAPNTIHVAHTGKVGSKGLLGTRDLPGGMEVRRPPPPANRAGKELVWTLGDLPAGDSRTIQVVFGAKRVGQVKNVARVETEEGLKDE